jgi:ATP-dependent helicase/nuclease subunit B
VTKRVQPKVCTIVPERPFLSTLADGLLSMTAGDLMRLPRVTIVLPTRREACALREAFLRAPPEGREAGTPLLLPRMRPIGDLDSDQPTLADGTAHSETLAVPPAIHAAASC